jgi:uncharacterized repeat protein (TIGR03803 family)
MEGGTVFELVHPRQPNGRWVEHILYSFNSKRDGQYPAGGLIQDAKGALYGVTSRGGLGSVGYGVLYRLTPPLKGTLWSETVLHAFTNANGDGWQPAGELIADAHGSFYGTTQFGGIRNGPGIVYELIPPVAPKTKWHETVLHQFTGAPSDGGQPSGLTFGRDGLLYGSTAVGGSADAGTIYEVTP